MPSFLPSLHKKTMSMETKYRSAFVAACADFAAACRGFDRALAQGTTAARDGRLRLFAVHHILHFSLQSPPTIILCLFLHFLTEVYVEYISLALSKYVKIPRNLSGSISSCSFPTRHILRVRVKSTFLTHSNLCRLLGLFTAVLEYLFPVDFLACDAPSLRLHNVRQNSPAGLC